MPTPTSTLLPTRLVKLQSFKETVWGTPGASTAKWMGVQPTPTFKPYLHPEILDEERASLAPAFLTAITKKGGEFSFNQHSTYEDIIFQLGGGLLGGVTPTGGPVYIWDFAAGLTSQWAIQSYSFEFGYDISTICAAGATIQKWGIKSEPGKQWESSMSGFYKTHTQNGTFTAGLTDRTVEAILHGTTALSMDAGAGTVGTTAFTGTLVGFALEVDNGVKPVWTGDLEPTTFANEKIIPTLELKLLYTSAVKTFLTTNWFSNLGSLIRLKSTSGTKIAQIDFSGVLAEDPTLYGNVDGAQILNVKLTGILDTGTFANILKAEVTNGVATIP